METRIGPLEVSHSARGMRSFTLELWHEGLKKHRLIRGDNQSIVNLKAKLQIDAWDQKWMEVSSRLQQRNDRAIGKRQQDERKAEAQNRTSDAQRELQLLAALLKANLTVDERVDWESLKDKVEFTEPMPTEENLPVKPTLPSVPREPHPTHPRYQPTYSLFDKLFASRRSRIHEQVKKEFLEDLEDWRREVAELRRAYAAAVSNHDQKLRVIHATHKKKVEDWEARRREFLGSQAARNAVVDAKRVAYEAGQPDAVMEFIDLVLASSRYPDYFPHEFEAEYDTSAKTAIIDYQLPAPADLPTLKAVKYVATRDEFEYQHISEIQSARQYDDVLYQIVLRTIHEVYEADVIGVLDAIVINGIVTAIDRTTGKPVTACVLSLRAGREEFSAIDLAQVDPKACFRSLKGIGSSKLAGLAPVPPIMRLRRDDSRFVSAYEVAYSLDESVNLAAMDWEDFEHLIREIFEKEFASTGGEVRVTRASRDGGVDAVAFDPDPIRGGKIVIQAKRYSNTVGVSAVRDLYGTILNEGATKGILVTTSDYGPDSYEFANGKPITLFSGANLLDMLKKHGHRARIDIQEAKKLVGER